MAVSLKKPYKVDLSSPIYPRKLPECTPIHLIDEEEPIVKNDDHTITVHKFHIRWEVVFYTVLSVLFFLFAVFWFIVPIVC